MRRNELGHIRAALADAVPAPFWLESPDGPAPTPPLGGSVAADLVVVGGGYCGLWTALIAKEREPAAKVVLLEAREVGWAASGRNGGFCESTLTHGATNGERHFADELQALGRLAEQNFADLEATLTRYGIDAEFEKTGVLVVATEEYQVDGLEAAARTSTDPRARFLDRAALDEAGLPQIYRAGLRKFEGYAYVHPAKLAWGLKRACIDLGVEIHEGTPALKLTVDGGRVVVTTPRGRVVAARAALATNGFPSLLHRLRLLTVPIYDYALVSEPLSPPQLRSIGWTERHGITDSAREFHYYRRTADDRILFGGFDAVYHAGGKIRERHDQRTDTFETLADHFFTTFPQLQNVRFTHKWGGMIDMSTQLVAFHGTAHAGKVAYSAGYTGLGVGATRFGAETMLDLLSGEPTDRTQLRMARKKPIPIPPEPFATPLIQMMRAAVRRADHNQGREGLLLKLADAAGVGFDS